MIAIDCQPFSVAEDVGFTHLLKQLEPRYSLPSQRYITEVMIKEQKMVLAAYATEYAIPQLRPNQLDLTQQG